MAARSVGARVRIEGAPQGGDMFLLANHVSWIDILALGGATGTAFVSHDGVAGWPVIGWLAAQNNTLFVARERRGALTVTLRFLQPFDPADCADRKTIAMRAHAAIAASMAEHAIA